MENIGQKEKPCREIKYSCAKTCVKLKIKKYA